MPTSPPLRLAPLLPLLLLAPAAFAADTTVTLDNALTSRYASRGVMLSHEAWQPTLTIGHDGLTFDLVVSEPLRAGELHELDGVLTFSREAGPGNWRLGYQLYTYPGASGGATSHSHEFFTGFDFTLPPVAGLDLDSSTTFFYDVRLQSIYLESVLSHTFTPSLGGHAFDLTFSVTGGLIDGRNISPDTPGPRVCDCYCYAAAGVEAVFKLGKNATFSLALVRDAACNADPAEGFTDNTSLTASLSWEW